ncbi:MAG: aminodeoxychorismate synthase component I [Sphingomonadaceae bacterium]|nr:aminodeoxychorismate synthase component I [Sphingomonadaceae bacterium]
MTFDPTRPFVLLDDARSGRARLFTGLTDTIVAATMDTVVPALARLKATAGHRAGFVAFEAGYALDPALHGHAPPGGDGLPLLWFGSFARAEAIDVASLAALFPAGAASIGSLEPAVPEATYRAQVEAILDRIAAGDLYQANLTFAAAVTAGGDPIALYRRLRPHAAAGHGALVHTGSTWLLSFSPELFFTLDDGVVTTRPMKGTAARGAIPATDDAAAAALAADAKTRAENLMIVDLLRNDLTRIAVPGTVAVPALFTVERFPTLLQLTSTVTATTAADPVDVLATLFPCGSVTGAPKIAAMRAIAATEGAARGVYTGSIGAIDADGRAAFNVAIRTLVLTADGGRIGLGAGIVADSDPAAEWRECLAKAAFLRPTTPTIIETMRVETGRVPRLDRHLARAASTAGFLGVPFDAAAAAAVADAAAAAHRGAGRLRLRVLPTGEVRVEVGALPPPLPVPARVALAPLPVATDDWRLRHKTDDRAFYDAARAASGTDEVVFVTADGAITEGSFTNVFVARGGVLLTPAAGALLPGVLRADLLARGDAREARLTAADLADGFFIGNALRGLMPARLVADGR